MVILETAAIGAAGYGAYRGGDAAIRKGKEAHKEMQRQSNRNSQRSELVAKTKARNQRISRLSKLRGGDSSRNTFGNNENTNSNTNSRPLGGRSSNAPAEVPPPPSIDERQKAVMQKLKQGNSKKNSNSGLGRLNIFKRKK